MKQKKKFHKKYVDRRIRVMHHVFVLLMLYMFAVVLYDSFVHELPFYYILFWFLGIIIGRLLSKLQTVVPTAESDKLTLEIKPGGIAQTIVLLLIRFVAGKVILAELNVIWVTDALYLVFIGIYFSRLKNIVKQIDERVYSALFGNKSS